MSPVINEACEDRTAVLFHVDLTHAAPLCSHKIPVKLVLLPTEQAATCFYRLDVTQTFGTSGVETS